MHRFYCPNLSLTPPIGPTATTPSVHEAEDVLSGRITVMDTEQTHHARHVLRLCLGDCVGVFDGHGLIGQARIVKWRAGRHGTAELRLTRLERVEVAGRPIDVAAAIPKGSRAGTLVHSLSQVGANSLIPLRCQQGAADPRRLNRRRFERTAIEAAKQCGRPYLLTVEPVTQLAEVLRRPYQFRLITMPQIQEHVDLPRLLDCAGPLLILIGPEGGWTQAEVAMALESGCKPWTFGPHVMRIETASAAAVSIVRYSCECYLRRVGAEAPCPQVPSRQRGQL